MHMDRCRELKKAKLIVRKSFLDIIQVHTLDNYQVVDKEEQKSRNLFCERIWGSCKGLICIQLFDVIKRKSLLYLWNPSTTRYREIPDYSRTDHIIPLKTCSRYGIGYNNNIEDYKIVRIYPLDHPYEFGSGVDVYSLKNNSWKSLADIPYELTFRKAGVELNGAFHWFATTAKDDRVVDNYFPLIAYDMKDEKCREFLTPGFGDKMSVQKFRERLCIFCRSELWVMNEYGVSDSWMKLLNLKETTMTRELTNHSFCWTTESGYLLTRSLHGSAIILYDPINKSCHEMHMKSYVSDVIYCLESIVSV